MEERSNRPTPQLNERVAFVDGPRIYFGTVWAIEPVRVLWDDYQTGKDDPWPSASWPALLRVMGGDE